jgi:hypothetical protein
MHLAHHDATEQILVDFLHGAQPFMSVMSTLPESREVLSVQSFCARTFRF